MGFRVKDANRPRMALSKAHSRSTCSRALANCDCLRSKTGEAIIYLIDRHEAGSSIYDIDFEYLDGVDHNPGCGFNVIDHLTHNVYKVALAYWANFYETLFNFKEIRYFDIKGEYTDWCRKR